MTSDMSGNYFNTYMKARIFCEREVPSDSSTQFVGAIDYQYNIISTYAACVLIQCDTRVVLNNSWYHECNR